MNKIYYSNKLYIITLILTNYLKIIQNQIIWGVANE